jgi:glutathione S-transferase
MHAGKAGGSVVSGAPLHLTYLTMRGLAELPRLILEEAGLPYIGTYLGREQFKQAKSSFPLGRVPVLKTTEGAVLSQSSSIVRYLAGKAGLDGKNMEERANVDMWYETSKELFGSHSRFGSMMNVEALRKGPSGGDDEKILHFKDTTNRGEYTDYQKAMAVLTTFEEALAQSESGFLVGDSLTYVDLALFIQLLDLEEEDNMPTWANDLKLPSLKAFKDRVEKRPAIQAYLQSDRLMPRIKRENDDYVYVKGVYSVPKQVEVEVAL